MSDWAKHKAREWIEARGGLVVLDDYCIDSLAALLREGHKVAGHQGTRGVGNMRSREGRYRDALLDVEELIQQLPGGADEDADPDDLSPRDSTAHIGGLILQRVRKALNR